MHKYKVVSISGIRFARLPGSDYDDPKIIELKTVIKNRLKYLYNVYNTRIIVDGFAEGIDLLTVLAVIELREEGYKFKLVAALPVPMPIQTKKFSKSSIKLYEKGLEIADKVCFVWELSKYRGDTVRDNLLNRNLYMRDISDASLVVTDFNEGGGTTHFFNNSIKLNRDMTVIDLNRFNGKTNTLECHSRGDKRFSPLYAKIKILGKEDTIENWYQESKSLTYPSNDKKGKKPDYFIMNNQKLPLEYAEPFYNMLWVRYLKSHPLAYTDASTYDKFHDMFKSKSGLVDQGTAIRKIINMGLEKALLDAMLIEKILKI